MMLPLLERPLADLHETYASLRLPSPSAERAMAASLERFGQLTPIRCQELGESLEVIDGFKRLRGARLLNWTTLQVAVLATTVGGAKAGMLVLNRRSSTIGDLEEALIIRSLHREEGISQQEIAVLVGRHPSWVCRRLALLERLHEEVLQHLRLGLISSSIAREVAKLPRGNQPALLALVIAHRLGKRDVETVTSLLRGLTVGAQRRLLAHPKPLLERHPSAPAGSTTVFFQRVAALLACQTRVLAGAAEEPLPTCERELNLLREAEALSRRLCAFLPALCSDRDEIEPGPDVSRPSGGEKRSVAPPTDDLPPRPRPRAGAVQEDKR